MNWLRGMSWASGSQMPPLFNGWERALMAIVVTLLVILATSLMAGFDVQYLVGMDEEPDYISIDRFLRYIRNEASTLGHLYDFLLFGLVAGTPFAVFFAARRRPGRIVVGLVCLTVVFVSVAACYTPKWISEWGESMLR